MAKLMFSGVKPISINSAYYRNRKLTQKARQYRSAILTQLQSQLSELHDIKSQFDATKHCLAVSYTFYIPEEYFYTKKGELSLRSQDLDNCLKLPQDFIFNPKYETQWLKDRKPREKPLYKSISSLSNLAIDDKFIQRLEAQKLPTESNKYSLEVEIKLIDLNFTSTL